MVKGISAFAVVVGASVAAGRVASAAVSSALAARGASEIAIAGGSVLAGGPVAILTGYILTGAINLAYLTWYAHSKRAKQDRLDSK